MFARWLRTPLGLALALMLICCARHYLYPFVPDEVKGLVSKSMGGLGMLGLLGVVYVLRPCREVAVVGAWFAAENLLVFVCPLAYIAWPWPTEPHQSMCYSWTGLDMDKLGIAVCAGILVWLLSTVKHDSAEHGRGP